MGLLSFFSKSTRSKLVRLPSGSFTLDRSGKIMTSTLPQSFPAAHMRAIGEEVLASFQAAQNAQMPLAEIIIMYPTLKLLARELRGGALIFLMPLLTNQPVKKSVD